MCVSPLSPHRGGSRVSKKGGNIAKNSPEDNQSILIETLHCNQSVLCKFIYYPKENFYMVSPQTDCNYRQICWLINLHRENWHMIHPPFPSGTTNVPPSLNWQNGYLYHITLASLTRVNGNSCQVHSVTPLVNPCCLTGWIGVAKRTCCLSVKLTFFNFFSLPFCSTSAGQTQPSSSWMRKTRFRKR